MIIPILVSGQNSLWKVVDLDKKPIGFLNVLLFGEDSTFIKGTYSCSLIESFIEDVPHEDIYILVNGIGYKDYSSELLHLTVTTEIKTMTIEQDAYKMDEVAIKESANKIE